MRLMNNVFIPEARSFSRSEDSAIYEYYLCKIGPGEITMFKNTILIFSLFQGTFGEVLFFKSLVCYAVIHL